MIRLAHAWLALLLVAAIAHPAAAAAADPPKPLFAGDDVIHIVIKGPIAAVSATGVNASAPRPATLAVAGSGQPLPILLSPRGISRRTTEFCEFAPLRVEFSTPPPPSSLFAGQKKLKLVTHCRNEPNHQQYLLLEYVAYRLYNVLSPLSFRVRLASVDYVAENGAPLVSRLGFFVEDERDAARRAGLREAKDIGAQIAPAQLSAADAARVALFEYMIGNLDWSMSAGPAGEDCCHNIKLARPPGKEAGPAAGPLVPIPYDFDMSGLVSAPYSFVPEGLPVKSVKQRLYRGYCMYRAEARAAAAEFAQRQAAVKATLDSIPQMGDYTRHRAWAFLEEFFGQIGDGSSEPKFLTRCQ